jgi:hypothetical protein
MLPKLPINTAIWSDFSSLASAWWRIVKKIALKNYDFYKAKRYLIPIRIISTPPIIPFVVGSKLNSLLGGYRNEKYIVNNPTNIHKIPIIISDFN